ncbi:hypothetical protein HJC23_003249 [Cyclotella cryptica]|uniref:MMS19 nucleotide excision repair protein n=1 Tax=Cyclotella cryptica TaxID=29204 RepID=A0ABD3QZ66_9STRA
MQNPTTASDFQSWVAACTNPSNPNNSPNNNPSVGDVDSVAIRLRQEARLHFQQLSSPGSPTPADADADGPSSLSTVAQDLSKASSSTPNGALAILVSALRPAISTDGSVVSRRRGLHCLEGALEGTSSLTQGVRQAVGNFLVELCRVEGEQTVHGATESFVDAENLTAEEVTRRLQAMEQAHTAGHDSNSFAAREDVRDSAVACLKALLRSRLDFFPTQQSKNKSLSEASSGSLLDQPIKEARSVVCESVELRLKLAMSGVCYRCASDPIDTDEKVMMSAGDGYDAMDLDFSIEEKLSKLPRAKRSLCFELLDGALDGMKEDVMRGDSLRSELPSSESDFPPPVMKTISNFASFTASCLHGETDPRCLLQLLRLLNKMQRKMCPLFDGKNASLGVDHGMSDSVDSRVHFPSTQFFDAVAPYYPVHFTPPKNDPHKITRDMLHDALMAVLCEKGVVIASSPMADGVDNMIVLAARMFMERLDPLKSTEYHPPSNGAESEEEDKLEAVGDLSTLFLPSNSSVAENESMNQISSLNVTRVPPSFLTELSSTLTRVHEDAVSSYATDNRKSLASAIRQFSSSLAHSLEMLVACTGSKGGSDRKTSLWEAFVVNTINRLSPAMESSPQSMHGRASTAYLASLAAGGGIETLSEVLSACIPRFLRALSIADVTNSTVEKTNLVSAMRGMAAMMSSCRVVMERWQRGNTGVRIHPHPLASYLSSIIERIANIFNSPEDDEDEALSSAAVAALESMLTSADLRMLNDHEIALLTNMLSLMAEAILAKEDDVFASGGPAFKFTDEWKTSCARTVGVLIATSLCEDEINDSPMEKDIKLTELTDSLLRRVMNSAVSRDSSSDSQACRYDWIVLATACSFGNEQVAREIVSELLSKTMIGLRSPRSDCPPIMAFSFISRNGGPNVAKAFHMTTPPSTSVVDIINELCKPLNDEKSPSNTIATRGQLFGAGMSHLQLPAIIAKDEEECHSVVRISILNFPCMPCFADSQSFHVAQVERAYSILPYLIPVFQCPPAVLSFDGLAKLVEQVLPPLSRWDEVKLCVCLPLVASILSDSEFGRKRNVGLLTTVNSMIRHLAEFVMRSDHESRSRSAAASCLFSIFINFDDGSLTSQEIIEGVIFEALVGSLQMLGADTLMPPVPTSNDILVSSNGCAIDTHFFRVENIFSFMSVLGSAAACKGGSHSKDADLIATFLIEMACTGSSSFPFSKAAKNRVTWPEEGRNYPSSDRFAKLSLLPAFSFGSMISVYNGIPFWRQRVVYKTISYALKALQDETRSLNPPALGPLAVCATLCCLPVSLLSESNLRQMIPILVAGLVHLSKDLSALNDCANSWSSQSDVLGLILAALIKQFALSPEVLARFTSVIISSLTMLCACTKYDDSFFPKQILALQCLENAAKVPSSRNAKLRERDQVVAVLSVVLDHPSVVVRQAVVHVRNVWLSL